MLWFFVKGPEWPHTNSQQISICISNAKFSGCGADLPSPHMVRLRGSCQWATNKQEPTPVGEEKVRAGKSQKLMLSLKL